MRIHSCFSLSLSLQILKSNLEVSSVDLHHARTKINELEEELSVLNKDRENLLARVEELAAGFESQNDIQVSHTNTFNEEVVFSKSVEKGFPLIVLCRFQIINYHVKYCGQNVDYM